MSDDDEPDDAVNEEKAQGLAGFMRADPDLEKAWRHIRQDPLGIPAPFTPKDFRNYDRAFEIRDAEKGEQQGNDPG